MRAEDRSNARAARLNAALVDTAGSIGPWHVVAGVHIGAMSQLSRFTNIKAVLTVAESPGLVPDEVRHRHTHLSYQEMDEQALSSCVDWVLHQVHAQRPVLIRSERGLQRPALVAAMAVLQMGGGYYDATSCVHRANYQALTDFRYQRLLKDAWHLMNP